MSQLRTRQEDGFTLVELLVTILILSVVMTGITSVVISTMRTEQYQRSLQDVVDDGRLSLARIRKELRSARRVHETSNESALHFWVDKNQDALVQPEEQICYEVEAIGTGRYQISRWTHHELNTTCAAAAAAGQPKQVVARTLVHDGPFVGFTPIPGGVDDPPTREVIIRLDLEVAAGRGPDVTTVEGAIRLRNVP
jgi:prepilin-type N-terminal cleavage/methylation domain-containing protein